MLLAAVLLLLVIAFFGTFFINGGTGSLAGDIAGSAAQPVVAGASGFGASISDFFNRLFALRDVDKQYAELKTRVQILEAENQLMQETIAENERLTEQLGFKKQYPEFTCLPARVIGKEPGSWFIDFTLDMGSDQGVHVDMTVVNELGLVGRVIEVGHKWCKVMAVIDRQSYVSAVIERSRDSGMVQGSGDPQGKKPLCDILFLQPDSEIVPGDKVLTSDLAGIFPKGITIGIVTTVSRDNKLQRIARLAPSVDFAHIENVLIITSSIIIPTESEIAAEESAAPEGGN